ncbi:unnamed protein product, partial [Prorocentrum cordatum]
GVIVGPRDALRVHASERLPTTGTTTALQEELDSHLVQLLRKSGPKVRIAELDVSRNPLVADQVGSLLSMLAHNRVLVERLRFAGCPNLDDDAARRIAEYSKWACPR